LHGVQQREQLALVHQKVLDDGTSDNAGKNSAPRSTQRTDEQPIIAGRESGSSRRGRNLLFAARLPPMAISGIINTKRPNNCTAQRQVVPGLLTLIPAKALPLFSVELE